MGVYMNKIQEVTEKKGIILDTPCSMLCITYRYGVFHRESCPAAGGYVIFVIKEAHV